MNHFFKPALKGLTLSILVGLGTTAAAEELSGPYVGISVEPITYTESSDTNDLYFEVIDVQAGFSKVLANDVFVAGEGVYNLHSISSVSELYGANAKLGLALQDNLAIYGLAGLFAVEGDDGGSDDGVSYGAGITYAVTETFQVVGEASFTEFSGLDKISAKAGAIYSFDL